MENQLKNKSFKTEVAYTTKELFGLSPLRTRLMFSVEVDEHLTDIELSSVHSFQSLIGWEDLRWIFLRTMIDGVSVFKISRNSRAELLNLITLNVDRYDDREVYEPLVQVNKDYDPKVFNVVDLSRHPSVQHRGTYTIRTLFTLGMTTDWTDYDIDVVSELSVGQEVSIIHPHVNLKVKRIS